MFILDGPHDLQLRQQNTSLADGEFYNLCPGRSLPITVTCSSRELHPSANFNLTLTLPEGHRAAACHPETTSCSYSFTPTSSGDHNFRCSAVNNVLSELQANSPDLRVTVRGGQCCVSIEIMKYENESVQSISDQVYFDTLAVI